MATFVLITDGKLHLVLVTLLCTGVVTGRQSSRSFCRTESVVEGEQASITCHFPEDVTVHKHSVNIMRYDFQGGSFLPELILRCFWEQHSNSPNCSAAEGYDFSGRISDTLTVFTTAATKRHIGTYACNYAGEDPSEFNICRLNVKSNKISCTAAKVVMGETASLTCHFNTNVNQSKEGFYVKRIPTDSDLGEEWDVLTCNWVEQFEDGIFCHTKAGCNLVTKTIGDKVTVEIAAVGPTVTGEYFCDTVPHTRGVTVEHCRLTAEKTTKSTVDTPSEEPASSARGTGKSLRDILFYQFCVTVLVLYTWQETKR